MGFTRSAQILWTDIEFQCNGVITELKSWFQVQNGSGIVSMSLQFQIWQPINGTLYELVSEVAIPSAMNNELITTNNLSIPFYEASIVGVYVMIPANIGPANISVITNETEPKKDGYYYYTNDRPCLVDSRDGDTISSILNPKVALFYGKFSIATACICICQSILCLDIVVCALNFSVHFLHITYV